MRRRAMCGVTALLLCWGISGWTATPLPKGFVRLQDVDSTIRQDIRYFGSANFLGRPVPGYAAPVCLLTREAATALAAVQAELKPMGLGLKVYDCYRPQRAVDAFVSWAVDPRDQRMKRWFYPTLPKEKAFSLGYIAAKSGHSRGSTVDLTLIPLDSEPAVYPTHPAPGDTSCRVPSTFYFRDESLPMGTAFDCFDPLSHTDNPAIPVEAAQNRQLLKQVMTRHGFQNLPEEWWHYTLLNEPYPTRYFGFPVQ